MFHSTHYLKRIHIWWSKMQHSFYQLGIIVKPSTKYSLNLPKRCFQCICNQRMSFQTRWTINVDMTLASRSRVRRTNNMDIPAVLSVCSMHSKWRSAVIKLQCLLPFLSLQIQLKLVDQASHRSRCNDSFFQQRQLSQRANWQLFTGNSLIVI